MQQGSGASAEAGMAGTTTFSQEMADLICEQIADGKSLRSICKADDMPAMSTVFKWLSEQSSFSEQYARAREVQADALFDEVLSIADQYDNVQDALNTDHIQRAKLRIDTRKWMAGKLQPKKYGDKVQQDINLTVNHEDALGELE